MELRNRLADLETLSDFLVEFDLPHGRRIDAIDALAERLGRVIRATGGGDPLLPSVQRASDALLARAFHRLDPDSGRKLLQARLQEDVNSGSGRDYLCRRIDLLMTSPALTAREDVLVLKRVDFLDGVAYASHYQFPGEEARSACGAELPGSWEVQPWARASCPDCARLLREGQDQVARRSRNAEDQVHIYRAGIVDLAGEQLEEDHLRQAPVQMEDFDAGRRRSLWMAWVQVVVNESSDIEGHSPISASTARRLDAFWDEVETVPPDDLPRLLV